MPTAIVTGTLGFIGLNTAKYLRSKGFRVIGVDARPLTPEAGDAVDRYERIALPDTALSVIIAEERPDYCIHAAGGASVGASISDPEGDFRSHVPVTYGLLAALQTHAPQCKTIYLSSAGVYGNPKKLPITEEAALEPISPYGYHKLLVERICGQFNNLYGSKISIVRIFSAFGPGLRKQLLWDIWQKASSSATLELQGTGQEGRDFIYIDDIVKAFAVVLSEDNFNGSIYNLATGVETTIAQAAGLMARHLDSDISIAFGGKDRQGDPKNWRADITKLKNLGFVPEIPFEIGVRRYVDWCRQQTT